VGKSDDGTLELLQSIKNSKLHIIETIWDEQIRQDGWIYSEQTNIALSHCTGDWMIYLQADEAMHEDDYALLREEIHKADTNPQIEALLFEYLHFYGSYDFIGTGRQWYRRELRAFRKNPGVVSWGDAQGFRIRRGNKISKLRALQTGIKVYHYGWVRPPKEQLRKILTTETYYHPERVIDEQKLENEEFDYKSAFSIKKFTGSHPSVMTEKIEADSTWTKNFNPVKLPKKPLKMRILDAFESLTGYRIGEYKDFKIIR